MILTGRHVSPEEGKELGFVNDVVPRDQLMDAAWTGPSKSAPARHCYSCQQRRGLQELDSASLQEAKEGKHDSVKAMVGSEDFIEGPKAFAEKRAPNWQGNSPSGTSNTEFIMLESNPVARDLIDRALAEVETLDIEAAEALLEDDDAVFVDLRDRELEREGMPNAFHAPRGMLEFWVDPSSPYHKEVFAWHCWSFTASAAGVRRWPPRPCKTWGWNAFATSATATAAGKTWGRHRRRGTC